MLLAFTSAKYNNCYIRCCFAILVLISIHSWWYIYKVNKKSHFLRSFFGIRGSECMVFYPENSTLHFRNTHWQMLNTSKCNVYIFGAYLDVRNDSNPLIRFTTMFDKLEPKVRLHAQVWYKTSDVAVSLTTKCEFRLMWHLKWGTQSLEYPFLVSCTLRENLDWKFIAGASLVENICDRAYNRINIRRAEPNSVKNDFGICVKGLNINHEHLTIRIIEWIEMMHLLGVHKIFFYELSIHPQLKRLLQYYVSKQKVSVVPISLPNPTLRKNLLSKRHNEMIVYNDCFYQHHDEYKYIVLLDIDEAIVPTTVSNWQDLFVALSTRFKAGVFPTINSICVRNIYFLDEFRSTHRWFQGIPRHMHMLQHVYRQRNFSRVGYYTKCFHSTRATIMLHNHFAFACPTKCLYHHLDVKLAQLNHYRSNCHNGTSAECDGGRKQVVMDFGMWRYREELLGNVTRVMEDLRLESEL